MKKLLLSTIIIFTLVLSACSKEESIVMNESIIIQESAKELSFTNDLHVVNIGDPFVLKVSPDSYYMYCTSASNGFYCWHSADMIHWAEKKMCYTKPAVDSWSYECYWAPEVVFYNNQYYLFYTARHTNGSLKIGLAISDTPDGPFIDYKNEPLFDTGYACIDANVLIDEDGSKYLYYSRDCSENIIDGKHVSQIYGVQLADDLKSIIGEPVLLSTPEQSWETQSGDYLWNEGPEMIKHNGIYYLSYSANYYESKAYSLGYSTSDSPLGPFVKADNNPILSAVGLLDVSGTGHHSFVLSPDSTELWACYHSHVSVKSPSGNRKANLAKCVFGDDNRLYINGPLTTMQPLPSGSLNVSNISSKFDAYINDENVTLLTDGLIKVHRDDSDLASTIEADSNNQIRLLIKNKNSEAMEAINGLALYFDRHGEDDTPIASIKLIANNTDCSAEYVLEDNSSPLLLSFNEISIYELSVIITLSESNNLLTLSEVELFSSNN